MIEGPSEKTSRVRKFALRPRMLAQELPFLQGEAGRLQDDRIGNRYLSDVVNYTRAPEIDNLGFRKLQMLSREAEYSAKRSQ